MRVIRRTYGDSVALALAGGKQSRLPTAFDVSSVT
jgi:hypothetical protein